jgi:cytochrome c-type biogenesis protein CcmH
MDSVITSLEQRLRAKGGSDGDWELLAKSYEFLKRPDAAALARAHQLPSGAGESGGGAATGSTVVQAAPAPAPPAKPLSAESERALAQAEAARQKRDFSGAEKIYAQLAAKDQMTAQSWADYADVTASLHNNSLAGKPSDYIRRALQLDPAQTKALWLQGSLEHETRQYSAAVATWRKLLAQMDPASSDGKLIQSNIDEDRRLGGAGTTVASAGASAGTTAGVAVRGDVALGAAMKARVKSGQTLYIVAKSVNSPGMPVAVRRLQTGTWPVTFELSDSDAMVPERKLSSVGPVTIEARISQTGQAASAPGDLLGTTGALDPAKAGALHLIIDREVR